MSRVRRLGVAVIAVGAGLGLLLSAASAWADLVVVRAAGGPLKAGQTLSTGTKVTLGAGASATLLGQDGKTITLNGPFSGIPEAGGARAGDPKVVATLARLLTAGPADTASLGVTRGTHIRDPYAVDLAGGPHCQVADKPAVFKRDLALGAATVGITSSSGIESTATWADGADTASWPASLPLTDGTYLLRSEGRRTPAKLMVRRVPAGVTTDAAVAAWMAEHGCRAQALAIVNALK